MASKQQSLQLIGWITADGTNFFEILVQFPFFPRFQIYSRLGDLIRISKDNQERKKCHSCVDLTENFTEIFFCQIYMEKSYATLNPITKLCDAGSMSRIDYTARKKLSTFLGVEYPVDQKDLLL